MSQKSKNGDNQSPKSKKRISFLSSFNKKKKKKSSKELKQSISDDINLQNDDDKNELIEPQQNIKTEVKMDEIDKLVFKMQKILNELNATCHTNNDTHHSMDIERFQKLIDWVDYNESHLCLLKQAWNDESFWPFVSTQEAEETVENDMQTMLIRLSNTKPGAITVTRKAKNHKLEDFVKHKRYFSSREHGKLTLTGSTWEREVTWDGLLHHLKQKECAICLEELKKENNVWRLNCGHHFHEHCVQRHIQHSKSMRNKEFANCPLCRKQIENAEVINEPSLAVYNKLPVT